MRPVLTPQRFDEAAAEEFERKWDRLGLYAGQPFERWTPDPNGYSVGALFRQKLILHILYLAIVVLVLIQVCMVIDKYHHSLWQLVKCPFTVDAHGQMSVWRILDIS